MMLVSDPVFTRADRWHRRTGLLGWVAVTLNRGIRLDGIAVRRTLAGRLAVSFPAKDGRYPYVRLVDATARREFEAQIIEFVGRELAG